MLHRDSLISGSTTPLDSDDVRLLTEIGFLASARGDVLRAEVIFGALMLFRPNAAFPYVGLATALMNARRPGEAAAVLAKAVDLTGADDDLVKAMQGLALHLDGHAAQSSRVLRDLISRRSDDEVPSDGVRLALELAGESSHQAAPGGRR